MFKELNKWIAEYSERRKKRTAEFLRKAPPPGSRPKAPPPPPKPKKLITEWELREQHEPLMEAWEQYQVLLKLYDVNGDLEKRKEKEKNSGRTRPLPR
jgi:hypothetical protein